MFELKIYFYNKPNKVGELSSMTADQSFVVRCLDSIISIEYSMKKMLVYFLHVRITTKETLNS